ncbi:MAG: MarR family transcriptional regulator [Actinomycetota bacterium]|nr:MarR family transcriptional regulator [Actinomycetota bacterium]
MTSGPRDPGVAGPAGSGETSGSAELGEELRTVIGELVRRARTSDELAASHAAALGHLDREGPATVAELAERCRVRHQSMAAVASRMTQQGEVESRPHPADGRARLLTITAAGRAELQRDRARRAAWLAAAIDAGPPGTHRDVAHAITVLRRLAEAEVTPDRGG